MIDLKDAILLEKVELSIIKSKQEWRSTVETAYLALMAIKDYESSQPKSSTTREVRLLDNFSPKNKWTR